MVNKVEQFWNTDLNTLSGCKDVELRPIVVDERVPSSELIIFNGVSYVDNGIKDKIKIYLKKLLLK